MQKPKNNNVDHAISVMQETATLKERKPVQLIIGLEADPLVVLEAVKENDINPKAAHDIDIPIENVHAYSLVIKLAVMNNNVLANPYYDIFSRENVLLYGLSVEEIFSIAELYPYFIGRMFVLTLSKSGNLFYPLISVLLATGFDLDKLYAEKEKPF